MHSHVPKSQHPVSNEPATRPEATPAETGLEALQLLKRSTAPADNPPATPKIKPSHILQLQRKIGNQAVRRLLDTAQRQPEAAKKGGFIQRLLAVSNPANYSQKELYVPKDWLDSGIDDRPETLRQVVTDNDKADLKTELMANVTSILGGEPTIGGVVEVEPSDAQTIGGTLQTKQLTYLLTSAVTKKDYTQQEKGRVQGLLGGLATDLAKHNSVTIVDDLTGAQDLTGLQKILMFNPNLLVKAASDLGGFDITKVCGLIALYKAEGAGRVMQKLNIPQKNSDAEYYQAMHTYYRTDPHKIEYDEIVTHPALYTDWGYSMIFSGNTKWEKLPGALTQDLARGGYIFEIDGHAVYVRVKQPVTAGGADIATGHLTQYFEFHSDRNNFNTREIDKNVLAIFKK